MKKQLVLLVSALFMLAACNSQKSDQAGNADKVLVKDYFPTVVNNIPVTKVEKAKFPIIDMHSHDYAECAEDIAEWV